MSVYSKKTSRSFKSTRTNKTNQTKRSQNSIRPKLLNEIKNKHGFVHTQPWHIKSSLLERIQKPNPFNKLISSHDTLSPQMQSSVCSTLSTCIEMIINKKSSNTNDNSMETETEIDESIHVSSTELFAVFITLLENKNTERNETSLIILLSHLIPNVPINVLLTKFDDLAQKLGQYFNKNISSSICVQYYINCASSTLISRITNSDNNSFWSNEFCQKMLQGLFVLSADNIDKIRKLSLKHIKKILRLYSKESLPLIIKNLMRCFIERQLDGIINDNNTEKAKDLNVIAFIAELLMETLEYFTLKESSYFISLLFNVISLCTQSYGDGKVIFKQLNLQQMFLKLIYKFIKTLPNKFKLKTEAKQEQTNDNKAMDALANELKDKIDLKQLVNNMKLDDINDENEDKEKKYTRFVVQLFDVIQQLKPQKSDTVGVPIYYDCLVSIMEALYVFNKEESLQRCVSMITIMFEGFESNKKKIVQKASTSIVNILQIIVNEDLMCETKSKVIKDDDVNNDTLAPLCSPSVPDKPQRSKLPVLQRITILIRDLFDFKYKSSWIYLYSLCSALFRLFGSNGFFLLENILYELYEIRLMDSPLYLSYLEDVISSAIKWCGPENVLRVIPLNLPTSDVIKLITMDEAILKANLWLLPLLKNNVNRTNLAFFGSKLVPIADMMMKQSILSDKKNMIVHKKQFDAISHMIWSIFPSFCIYPSDINETFPKIAESIGYYLMEFKQVREYIIYGFIHLIKKPIEFIRRENEKGIFGNDLINKAKQQIETITKYNNQYLPILCNILVETDHDKRCNVLKAIALFAQIGDKKYITKHFERTMIKCLEDDTALLMLRKEIMDNDDDDDIHKLEEIKKKYETLLNKETAYLLIINEMIEFVDINELEKFWSFLKQQFMKTDQSPLIEKLLYKNLFTILNYRESVLLNDEKQLINFTTFIISLNHKQLRIGARNQRLRCIHTLIDCYIVNNDEKDDDDIDAFIEDDNNNNIESMKADSNSFINVYPLFIGELISNISLSNLKIRKESLNIIELIAQRLDDISSVLFDKFILKLLGGLLSKTSSMQSATILCLTYLIVQFELRIPPHILSELLKTISLRINDPQNNVIKSSLDFIQIVIQEMPDTILEENLMDLLSTLLKWINDDTKNKFKSKINKNIDLLLKRFGYEKIIKLVPNRFQRLIKYLRKRADYLQNKKEEKKKIQREERLHQKLFNKKLDELPPDHPLNIEHDNTDDDDDGKLTVFEQLKTERMSAKSRKSSKYGKMSDTESVRMKIDGIHNITDLCSKTSIKKQLISEYEANKLLIKEKKKRMDNEDKHIRELSDGRLLITLSDDDDDNNNKKKKKNKWKNLSDDEDDDDETDSDLSDNNNNDLRDVDDILSEYSKYNKMTQLKKALNDVKGINKGNKRLSSHNNFDVIGKRRRILDAVKNDDWVPGELQPYKYHMMSPALLSRKKRHFRQSAFQRVMGHKRNVVVRTDSLSTNSFKISRTRKVAHGRYTLKRSKIKAKQKHLIQDIYSKHRQNQMRKRARSKSKRNKKKRGKKRKLTEM